MPPSLIRTDNQAGKKKSFTISSNLFCDKLTNSLSPSHHHPLVEESVEQCLFYVPCVYGTPVFQVTLRV